MLNLTGEEIILLILFFVIFILPIIITGIKLYFKSKKENTEYDTKSLIKVILVVILILFILFGPSYSKKE